VIYTPQELLEFGWRIPFFLGGLFGLLAMYLRRWLHETPVFVALQQRKGLEEGLPLTTVLRDHRSGVLVSMTLTWALSAMMIVVILMTPTILQRQFSIAPGTALSGNMLATIGLVIGAVVFGALAGRFGSNRVIVLGCVGQSVCYLLLLLAAAANSVWIVPLYGLAGFSMGVIGAYPLVWVRSFPAAVRFSGISFSYNVAYALFGSVTPILIGFAIAWDRNAPIWYVAATSAITIAVIVRFRFQRAQPLLAAQADT
jgi:MFS family permease